MTLYRILDLDNCISDDEWRIKFIDWNLPPGNPRYMSYHHACFGDFMGNHDLVQTDFKLLILTGRPMEVRTKTFDWLRSYGVKFAHLLMRNNNDQRTSVDVKRTQMGWLEEHYGIQRRDIRDAYDDHKGVVEMYREEFGLKADVRCIHSTSAYVNPYTQ